MRKLKRTDVLEFKRFLYKKQNGLCSLCGDKLPTKMKDCALDHNHITGEVRGLLHMGCNRAEGIIFNAVAKWGKQGKDFDSIKLFLDNLSQYYHQEGAGVIYHLHQTQEQKDKAKRKKANARARARRRMKEG